MSIYTCVDHRDPPVRTLEEIEAMPQIAPAFYRRPSSVPLKSAIVAAIKRHAGNIEAAAQEFEVADATMRRWMVVKGVSLEWARSLRPKPKRKRSPKKNTDLKCVETGEKFDGFVEVLRRFEPEFQGKKFGALLYRRLWQRLFRCVQRGEKYHGMTLVSLRPTPHAGGRKAVGA